MNHAVGGILPAVSVFRESCYRHIVLYHCIVSYRKRLRDATFVLQTRVFSFVIKKR